MTTTADRIRNYEVAIGNLIREKEIARYDADTYRTAAGFLWQTVKAAYDEYLEYESLSEATLEQMLTALEWSAEDANETETT